MAFDIRGTTQTPVCELAMEVEQPVHSLLSVEAPWLPFPSRSAGAVSPFMLAANASQVCEWPVLEVSRPLPSLLDALHVSSQQSGFPLSKPSGYDRLSLAGCVRFPCRIAAALLQ